MEPATPKKNPVNMDKEAGLEESNQRLPNDPVLEIVARCGTIGDAIRCAAASKSLRRGILDAPFLRHLRGFLNKEYGDVGGGRPFIPTLLLGVYHRSGDRRHQPSFVPAASDGATKQAPSTLLPAALAPPPNRDGVGPPCEFGQYLPVASGRSLLLLRRRCSSTAKEHLFERHGPHPIELSVCNPTTGERLVLPPHHVQDVSHALLDVDLFVASSSSFKLLITELSTENPSTLHVQIFSSHSEQGGGGWGPALACPITSRFGESRFTLGSNSSRRRPRPIVLGDTVCWLCNSSLGEDRVLTWCWCGGVARPTCIDNPPPGYSLGRAEKCLVVLPSPADAAGSTHPLLGMIVIESCEIQVWACEKRRGGSARDWKLWHLINEVAIPQPMHFSSRSPSAEVLLRNAELLWFCEGSGALFLRPRYGPMAPLLFSLDMNTLLLSSMEVSKLEAREWKLNPDDEFCSYEVDMLSYMLFMMKKL